MTKDVYMMTKQILTKENIKLNVSLTGMEEVIRYTGRILVDNGYVEEAYIDEMLIREKLTSTYIGNQVAIPHGTEDSKDSVKQTGISLITIPEGVDFGNGNIAKVIIGIAGKGDEHLEILSNIAIVCSEEENVEKIAQASTKEEILSLFDEVNES
jgi:PTS system mannitol-specific IIA component